MLFLFPTSEGSLIELLQGRSWCVRLPQGRFTHSAGRSGFGQGVTAFPGWQEWDNCWICWDVHLHEGRERFDKANYTRHELFGLFRVWKMNVRKYPRQPIFFRFLP